MTGIHGHREFSYGLTLQYKSKSHDHHEWQSAHLSMKKFGKSEVSRNVIGFDVQRLSVPELGSVPV